MLSCNVLYRYHNCQELFIVMNIQFSTQHCTVVSRTLINLSEAGERCTRSFTGDNAHGMTVFVDTIKLTPTDPSCTLIYMHGEPTFV